MPRLTYKISPMDHGLAADYPSLQIPGTFSPWCQNVRVEQNSIRRRPGYSYKGFCASTVTSPDQIVYAIAYFKTAAGTTKTLVLTSADLLEYQEESDAHGYFLHLTEMYTTGTITSVTGTPKVNVLGSSTEFVTGGIAANDWFVVDSDRVSADGYYTDPGSPWSKIASVTDASNLVLNSSWAYTGTGTGAYRIRKAYTMPANERWSYTCFNDQFIFTNGNTDVQKYTGSGYASALNSTYAKQARYCMEYADRLIIADMWNVSSAARDPYMFAWSKNGDASDWTDGSSGSAWIEDTQDYITGLGKTGPNLVIYKTDSISFWHRTSTSTAPIERESDRQGVGLYAPYSLTDVLGSNVFLSKDDFYALDGDMPRSISKNKIRFKFFDIVNPTEAKYTWGFTDTIRQEVLWFANTEIGKRAFVWNWRSDEWSIYSFGYDITGAGKGALA